MHPRHGAIVAMSRSGVGQYVVEVAVEGVSDLVVRAGEGLRVKPASVSSNGSASHGWSWGPVFA